MEPSATLKNTIQYTVLAATTVQKIAVSTGVPFLASTAALTLSILEYVQVRVSILRRACAEWRQVTRSHKEDFLQITEYIHAILCTIVKLYSTSEINGVLPTALLYDIAKFTESDFTVVFDRSR
jgi:hypothetical protein